MASRNLPFEYAQRWPQIAKLIGTDVSNDVIEMLDRRDRDLEDYLAGAVRPLKTFNRNGNVIVGRFDSYWVPFSPHTRLFSAGLTTYGSGTVTSLLKQKRAGVSSTLATLSVTASGLFAVRADVMWKYGDEMWVEVSAAGTGNAGLVLEVI